MDGIPWDQVKAGDLDALQVVLLSSSTSRRLRALQELRDKNGSVIIHGLMESKFTDPLFYRV
jgi:hypothetical protein